MVIGFFIGVIPRHPLRPGRARLYPCRTYSPYLLSFRVRSNRAQRGETCPDPDRGAREKFPCSSPEMLQLYILGSPESRSVYLIAQPTPRPPSKSFVAHTAPPIRARA